LNRILKTTRSRNRRIVNNIPADWDVVIIPTIPLFPVSFVVVRVVVVVIVEVVVMVLSVVVVVIVVRVVVVIVEVVVVIAFLYTYKSRIFCTGVYLLFVITLILYLPSLFIENDTLPFLSVFPLKMILEIPGNPSNT